MSTRLTLFPSRFLAVDLFSGAGGLSLGLSSAGFYVVLAVEKDRQAASTYSRNHSFRKIRYRTQVLNKDIATLDFRQIAIELYARHGRMPDVIAGGPPCQGFSRANMKTRSASNPNSLLVGQFIRAIEQLRPKVALLENVADLRSFDSGRVILGLQSQFRAIGYEANYAILNAVDYGIPQRRRRIFVIATVPGYKVDLAYRLNKEIRVVTVWDAISDLPSLKNGNTKDTLPYHKNDEISPYQRSMRTRTNGFVTNNLVSRNSDLILERYKHIPQGGNWQNIPESLMENYADRSRCHHWIYRRLCENEPSVAITHFRKSMLIHPRENRGLTVREAARIQSFPDHYVFEGTLGSQQQQVANAVPPLLAYAVARRVMAALQHADT